MVDPREPITSNCLESLAGPDTRQPSSTTSGEAVVYLDPTRPEGPKQGPSLEIMLERLRLLSQDTIPAAHMVDWPSTKCERVSTESSSLVKGQQSSDVKDVTDMKVDQSLVKGSGQELHEKGDLTPATVLDAGKHKRSGICDILNTDKIIDSENLEIIAARSSIRGGRLLAHGDMPGCAPTTASSLVVVRTIGQQAEGQLRNAAAAGYRSLELQHKKPETKRKRVPKSAQINPLHRASSIPAERNTASGVVAEASPLPLLAYTAQIRQRAPIQLDIRQQPGKEPGAPFVPALQPQNLLRLSNRKASDQLNGKDNRGVEDPDIQIEKRTSKSRWRRSAATVYTANKWEERPNHQVPVATDIERIERNKSEQMITEESMHQAGEIGKKGTRQSHRANLKQSSFREQQRQPTQAFIEQFDGRGDAPSEVLAQSHARETLTSPSISHLNKQHKLSSTFLRYPEPITSHTGRKSHRPAYTITATTETFQSPGQGAERTDLAGCKLCYHPSHILFHQH